MRLWDWVKKLCDHLDLVYPQRQISFPLAMTAAAVMEGIYRLLPGQPEPPLTRYTVSVIAQSTTLDITASRNSLGYQPGVGMDEGLSRFAQWWKENQK